MNNSIEKIDSIYKQFYKINLNSNFIPSLKNFIEFLGEKRVSNAMTTACSKFNNDPSQAILYFCGICWNIIRGSQKTKIENRGDYESYPGVYLLLYVDEIVYVGKSMNITSRIFSHIIDENKIFDGYYGLVFSETEINTNNIEYETIKNKIDILEDNLIMAFRPKYNKTINNIHNVNLSYIKSEHCNKIYENALRYKIDVDIVDQINKMF